MRRNVGESACYVPRILGREAHEGQASVATARRTQRGAGVKHNAAGYRLSGREGAKQSACKDKEGVGVTRGCYQDTSESR